MSDSIMIKANNQKNVFVDLNEDGIWLSIAVNGGSAYCTIPKDQAQKMVDTLIHFLAQEVTE